MKARFAAAMRSLADRIDPSPQAQLRAKLDATGSFGSPILSHEKMAQSTRAVTRLEAAGYTVTAKNGGLHLQINDCRAGLIDFWPTTGKWWIQASKKKGQGLHALLNALGVKL